MLEHDHVLLLFTYTVTGTLFRKMVYNDSQLERTGWTVSSEYIFVLLHASITLNERIHEYSSYILHQ